MKCAAAFVLVSSVLLSQALAVLRPLFPVKPAPPLGEQMIVTGDDFVRGSSQQTPQFQVAAIDLNRLGGSGLARRSL
jgi:hypothetical protein